MARASKTVVPMLVVALMLVLDLSAGVSAIVPNEDNDNQDENYESELILTQFELDIPALQCNNENCPDKYLGIGFPQTVVCFS